MQCCICLVKSITCLAKATNKGFLSLQLNNFSSVYIQETLFFHPITGIAFKQCGSQSVFDKIPHSNQGKYFCKMASSAQTGTLEQQQLMCVI